MANLLFGISLFSLLFLWFFIPPLFCILVIFHYFWSLCIYQCLFLKIKNSYKALIILCFLALLWASGFCVYRFNIQWFADNELVSILFVCGFFTMPIYLLSFYFNSGGFNNKNTLINILKETLKNEALVKEINVKFFFAFSLLITLTSIWQLEVPQRIVFDIAKKALKTKVMKEVFIENIDENETFRTPSKTLLDCRDKNIACPFFSFKYPIYDIKARTDGKVRIDGKEKLVARIYGIAYSTSTLTRFLTGITRTKRLRYFISE